MTTDEHGLAIKPGHTGYRGPPVGPYVWLVERHDGKLYGPFTTRHEAVGYMAPNWEDSNDYEPKRVPAGSFRFDDVVTAGSMGWFA